MSRKQVVYYFDEKGKNPVWEFITLLPTDERDKCFEYIEYLKREGESVRRPVGDYIGQKLYELRPKQTRIIYFFFLKNHAVIVHVFRKKTNQIPESEIKLAVKRMNEFVVRYQKGSIRL